MQNIMKLQIVNQAIWTSGGINANVSSKKNYEL